MLDVIFFNGTLSHGTALISSYMNLFYPTKITLDGHFAFHFSFSKFTLALTDTSEQRKIIVINALKEPYKYGLISTLNQFLFKT